MGLVERGHELTVLRDFLTESDFGRGRVVLLTAPVATGRTELLRTFADEAARTGVHVLSATASRAERQLPFGVLRQLLQSARLPDYAGGIIELLDTGVSTAVLSQPLTESLDQPSASVLHKLCLALLMLIRQTSTVICVDDVQFCDIASLHCLLYLVRRLHSTRALLVLSETAWSGHAQPEFEAEVLRQPHAHRMQLGPLTHQGVHALLAEELGAGVAHRLADEAYDISGGNPLLVHGLITDYRASARGGAQPGLVVQAGFNQAVVSCLYRCEPTMLQVAQGIAVLGEPGGPARLGRLLEIEPEAVTQNIRALEAAGLLEGGRFRAAAVEAAVRGALPPGEQALLHGRAARILHDDGAPARAVAGHLLAADGVTGTWVVPLLHEAAEQALYDDQMDLALVCLRLAYECGTDERQRAQTRLALAHVEWQFDPMRALRRVDDLIQAIAGGYLTAREALAPISWLIWFGRVEEAWQAAETLRAACAGEKLDAPSPDLMESMQSARLVISSLYPAIVQHAGESAAGAAGPAAATPDEADGDPVRQVRSLLLVPGADPPTVERTHLLHAGYPWERPARIAGMAMAVLVYGDSIEGTTSWREALLQEQQSHRAPTLRALFATLRADAALRVGQLAVAERRARAALTHIAARSWGVGVGLPLAVLLHACTSMGRYDEALRHLRQPVPEALFQTPVGVRYLQARGRYFHATGRYSAALADFESCGELLARWNLDLPAFVSWRPDAAETCLMMGHDQRARDLMREQMARLPKAHPRIRGASLRVLAATADPAERLDLLRRAVNALRISGDRLELIKAYRDLGLAHLALGEGREGRIAVRHARDLARLCGAEGLTAGLPVDLEAAGATPEPASIASMAQGRLALADGDPDGGVAELSDAERRVASLAAQGHTNRQIAGMLFVTVSTVEQHLTRVYRKLNVSRRSDLPTGLRPGHAGPV
ncbi:AAA family ATPase [Dactylosporangium sp. NPDC051541]|uniref:helix-turn-helix transcriptional regulator n=1 Tax=Dactylosporangium sp. NPDC051541 TaxID=3363977 RepID=UPI0037B198A3